MSKKYCIKYVGLFECGYVKYHLYSSGKTVNLGSDYIAKKWATKFRFKWIANLCCKLLNKTTKDFRTFTVVDINTNN